MQQPEHPLYRCYLTICEMLTDRGYNVPEKRMSQREFFTLVQTPNYFLTYTKTLEENKSWTMQIFFVIDNGARMGKKEIQAYKKVMEKNKVQAAILVLMNVKITSYAVAEIEESKPAYWIEYFPTAKLQINITKHSYQPKFRLLTQKEKQEMLRKFSAKVHQLPKMAVSDPIAKYFAAIPGDIFEIERNSETRGVYTNYRYVF